MKIHLIHPINGQLFVECDSIHSDPSIGDMKYAMKNDKWYMQISVSNIVGIERTDEKE